MIKILVLLLSLQVLLRFLLGSEKCCSHDTSTQNTVIIETLDKDIVIGSSIQFDKNTIISSSSSNINGGTSHNDGKARNLMTSPHNNYYYETTELGELNYDVVNGNPLKGFAGDVLISHPIVWNDTEIDSSLHYVRVTVQEVMLNDPDIVGSDAAFNWAPFDASLQLASDMSAHVIVRFFFHWLGAPLFIPSYLFNPPYSIGTTTYNNEIVPYYGDPQLLKAIRQFIYHFAQRYDGDTRIYAIQAGLLGFWGEWHTWDCMYNASESCLPEYVQHTVVEWYHEYIHHTKVQFRYPYRQDAYQYGFGFHDDSFSYSTLSGIPNGGVEQDYFFWPYSESNNTTEFWKHSPSGGEIRPESNDLFTDEYPVGTEFNQDPMLCIDTIHTSFLAWNMAATTGTERQRVHDAHVHMGYNFQLSKVSVSSSSSNNFVTINVTIRQVGIAPFYYPLSIVALCDGGVKQSETSIDANYLVDFGSKMTVTLLNISTTPSCLASVEFQLNSTYAYANRTIKWAQGFDGRVVLAIPPPPTISPVPAPAVSPMSAAPVSVPSPILNTSFIPERTTRIGNCTLVCATTMCPNGIPMGSDIEILSNFGDDGSMQNIEVPMDETGTLLSIQCARMGDNLGSMTFAWLESNIHRENFAPFAMNGGSGLRSYTPVDYLSSAGTKNITVQIRYQTRILDSKVLIFTMVLTAGESTNDHPQQQQQQIASLPPTPTTTTISSTGKTNSVVAYLLSRMFGNGGP